MFKLDYDQEVGVRDGAMFTHVALRGGSDHVPGDLWTRKLESGMVLCVIMSLSGEVMITSPATCGPGSWSQGWCSIQHRSNIDPASIQHRSRIVPKSIQHRSNIDAICRTFCLVEEWCLSLDWASCEGSQKRQGCNARQPEVLLDMST